MAEEFSLSLSLPKTAQPRSRPFAEAWRFVHTLSRKRESRYRLYWGQFT